MKKLVAIVVGTRPEVIKMAPVYFAVRNAPDLQPLLVSTGQHREMLAQAFAVFGLKPDLDLNLMQAGQTLPDLTARVIVAMTEVLRTRKPAAVLVQGDTTTVLGSALASFYERIPVGHVEAGLRTYDMAAPWPEEMNRRLADPISLWCFAPTELSRENLLAERISADRVFVTGNTVIDALLMTRQRLLEEKRSADEVCARTGIPAEFAEKYLRSSGAAPWILITGHRRESFGRGFEDICNAIGEIGRRFPEVGLLYPVHLNPNVQEPVRRILGANPRIAMISPVGYEDFIWLLDRCRFALSDSGGVQEEAPSLGKPVLVMRTTTERPEGVSAGTCRLVGTDPDAIVREASLLLTSDAEYARRSNLRNPYGDGTASAKIAEILGRDLSV